MAKPHRGEAFVQACLEKLLQGEALSLDELKQLLAEKECTLLDFKSGKLSDDKNELKAVIRQYVAAFANGDGGILCIGPRDSFDAAGIRPLDPITAPTPGLEIWTRDILVDLMPYLSPLPRSQSTPFSDGARSGELWFVAVARAPGLVPLYDEGKRPSYWVRFHDSNRRLPEYLAADVILGRRRQPALELRGTATVSAPQIQGRTEDQVDRYGYVAVTLRVENLGFLRADNVVGGMVTWSREPREVPGTEPSYHLRQYLTVEDPSAPFNPSALRLKVFASNRSIGPVAATLQAWQSEPLYLRKVADPTDLLNGQMVVPVTKGGATNVSAAAYLLADGCQPRWYQLQFRVKEKGLPHFEFELDGFQLAAFHSDRPVVRVEATS
jgi:hypothetical protein